MEGYWATHYRAGPLHGEGVVMLRGGELLGGDAEHMWRGSYELEGTCLSARVRIMPLVTREEEGVMAREKPLILSLAGTWTGEFAWLEGHPDGLENLPYHVEMRRCHALHAAEQKQAA